MRTVIEHEQGLTLSIKTFRPLWVFPWFSSIWRQFPLPTCIATIGYANKHAAENGHKELAALLRNLTIGPEMREPFQAIESFAKKKTGVGIKSYRIYSGHRGRRQGVRGGKEEQRAVTNSSPKKKNAAPSCGPQ